MIDSVIAIDSRTKEKTRPNWRRKGTKAKRVSQVVTDHSVFCPRCGDPMQLSHAHTFRCGHCGQEIAADDAIKVLEASAAL